MQAKRLRTFSFVHGGIATDVDVLKKFCDLRLKHCAENIETILEQAAEKNLLIQKVMERLLEMEIEKRPPGQNIIALQTVQNPGTTNHRPVCFFFSRFTKKNRKTQSFNFWMWSLNDKKDVILIGNPGIGKSLLN